MTSDLGSTEPRAGFKQAAAERAVDLIEQGMTVRLGTGSTALHAIRSITDPAGPARAFGARAGTIEHGSGPADSAIVAGPSGRSRVDRDPSAPRKGHC